MSDLAITETQATQKIEKQMSQSAALNNLARSRRGGYVEELVDERLKAIVETYNDLVDRYNAIASELEETKSVTDNSGNSDTSSTRENFSQADEAAAEEIKVLYAAAQATAREYVANARSRADALIADAENAAKSTHEALESEIKEVRAQLKKEKDDANEEAQATIAEAQKQHDVISTETAEITSRLKAFHEEQLHFVEGFVASFVASPEKDSEEGEKSDDVVSEASATETTKK